MWQDRYPDPPLPPDYIPDIDAYPLRTVACVQSVLRVHGSADSGRVLVLPGTGRGYCLTRKVKDCIMGAVYAAVNCTVNDDGSMALGAGTSIAI